MNVGRPSLTNHSLWPSGPNAYLGSWLCRCDAVLPPSSSHTTCSPPPTLLETPNLSHVLPCMWHGWHVIPFIQHSLSCIVLLKEALVWKTSHQLNSWLLPWVAFCPCRRVITELGKGLCSVLVPTVNFIPIPHATSLNVPSSLTSTQVLLQTF